MNKRIKTSDYVIENDFGCFMQDNYVWPYCALYKR